MEPQPPPGDLTVPPPIPATPPPPTSNPLAAGGVWMLVVAAFLLLCGMCSALFYVVLPLVGRNARDLVQSNVIFGSAAGFGLVLGAVFVWQGIRSVRGRASVPAARAFPPLIALGLAFVGAVLLGAATLALQSPAGLIAAFAFPPWHLLAASLPPLALLAYGARRLGRESGLRALLTAFGWGALAATALAFTIEIMVALVFILIASVIIASLPDSSAIIDQMQAQLRQAQRTQDFSGILEWFSSPLVTLVLLLYFSVIVPPVEEAVKALVVAFADPRRTRAADALLWGMGAGAGFGVLESIFNSSVNLEAWAPLIVMRAGAAVLHVANGAAMGLGWYAARVERRWGRLLLAYVACVIFHAAWNGTAVVLSGSLGRWTGGTPAANPATLLGGIWLFVLFLLSLLGLAWIVYAVRRQQTEIRSADHTTKGDHDPDSNGLVRPPAA